MKVDIHLYRNNRSILVRLCRQLFSNFKYFRIRKESAILKRRWYSLSREIIPVVDLVFLHIPHAINERHIEHDMKPIFKENIDLTSAVEYFGVKSLGEDIIKFLKYHLDDLIVSVDLDEEFDPEPILLERTKDIDIEETYATKRIFVDSIAYFYNSITEIITEIRPKLRVVYMNTESACNSPPIRAPSIARIA